MEEIATVVDVSGNKIRLSFSHHALCKRCGACHISEDGSRYLEVDNTVSAKIGDKVLLKIRPSGLKISVFIYGVPSLVLIIGIFCGYFLFDSDISAILTGVILFFTSFLLMKIFAKVYNPEIEKILRA
ncbi:MAG: SoxR reducing system RseC family protein [Elusimicrobia bacterium]|nr:SoxR reducing system RseC family protein [Elusimicrobiota bacterium]